MVITTKKIHITFFGSGPVAAKSLSMLAENFIIDAVVTKPVPRHHRGSFPVIEVAEELNVPILTVSDKSELDLLFATQPVSSKIAMLIDFGIIVSEVIINYFPFGIINSHFSILPEWRGADPITFSLLSGQKATGVSLMLLTAGLDTGPVIAYSRLPLAADETSRTLTNRLISLSNELILRCLPSYMKNPRSKEQSETSRLDGVSSFPTYSRKISKNHGHVNWHKPASLIEREIRAFEQWPKSSTTFAHTDVILVAANVTDLPVESFKPGAICATKDKLFVACLDVFLEITVIKPISKKQMNIKDFLAGYLNKL